MATSVPRAVGASTAHAIAVLPCGCANPPPRSLAGTYGGIGAEATVGYGIGANALIGGPRRGFILQPLSVQAQTGLNIAAGVRSLVLSAEKPIAEEGSAQR